MAALEKAITFRLAVFNSVTKVFRQKIQDNRAVALIRRS